jgi:hypothetical protein
MLNDTAEMCSGFARVETYVSSAFCRDEVKAASPDAAAADDDAGLMTITPATAKATVSRYIVAPYRLETDIPWCYGV